ncbi:ankyrin repeat domain family member sosondowah [Glossina fuscipes fuscipes]
MDAPLELSLAEIRKYMLSNGCKVTNHALVKHFRCFLTNPDTQSEARKEFKTYVNVLATIKTENNQKYLTLRKKYLNECPSDDVAQCAILAAASELTPSSPGATSFTSDNEASPPFRQPPPYKPPPEVNSPIKMSIATSGGTVETEIIENFRDCVDEFTSAMDRLDTKRRERQQPESLNKNRSENHNCVENNGSVVSNDSINKENIPIFSFSSVSIEKLTENTNSKSSGTEVNTENAISVKEATRKFNRMASEEEAKIISPSFQKKKTERHSLQENELPEVTLAHPKAKEWIVSMAKDNYQELAKLTKEYPELVKLQSALHWAAKHGNEDVVKLIAGTHKADVNGRTVSILFEMPILLAEQHMGYTPLHIAMQFDRANIFALLCNTYKANRDLLDWAGNKALDYSKQQTSVSASTYSSEYCAKFLLNSLNNNYHFELPPNMRNLSVNNSRYIGGGTVGSTLTHDRKRSQLSTNSSLTRTQSLMATSTTMFRVKKSPKKSVPYLAGSEKDLLPHKISPPNSSPELGNIPSKDARNGGTPGTSMSRRKESFLRKTIRAATASNRNQCPNVTNYCWVSFFYFFVLQQWEIKAKRKPTVEKDLGFLRIGSLNVRVKKTTEAFSNFLGVGNGNAILHTTNHLPQRHQRHHHHTHHLHVGSMRNSHHLHPMMKANMKKSATMMTTKTPLSFSNKLGSRASVPINSTKHDMLHKSWGSADNITQANSTHDIDNKDENLMPPPKGIKKSQKTTKLSSLASSTTTNSPRDSISSTSSTNLNSGYSSMPTTPNQLRSSLGLDGVSGLPDSDSDSACGFDSNWSIGGRQNSSSSSNFKSPKFP